jgi:hypothetical protein
MERFFSKRSYLKGLYVIITISLLFISCKTDVKELTIRVKSRIYLDFKEDHTIKMYEKFNIADLEMEAVAVDFLPDFAIDTLTHKAFSRSDTLKNPAVKILIIDKNEKKEEVWAFPPGMMRHYSARSFIGFELLSYKTGGKYIKPSNNVNRDK